MMSSAKIYRLFNVDSPFDPTNRFQTAYLLSPIVLGCTRLLISLYIFCVLLYELIRDGILHNGQAVTHWSYFTNITYWSIGFYMAFSGFHTVIYARRRVAPLQHWPRILQLLHSLFYTTIIIYPFLVTVIYWVILSSAQTFSTTFTTWSNISEHAMNTLFALFELLIPRTQPPPWIHLLFVLIMLALYLGVAYITHVVEGFWVYDFLDPTNGEGKLCGYVFGILVAIIVWFCVVYGVLWLKTWVFETKLRMKGKLAKNLSTTRLGDEEMRSKDGERLM